MSNPKYPHSPDVRARQTEDGGFSRGWGLHFQPCEKYWIDCHNHLRDEVDTPAKIHSMLDRWFGVLDAYRLACSVTIVNRDDVFGACRDVAAHDSRFAWMYRMKAAQPDANLLAKSLEYGACGLKLHNADVIRGESAPDIWRSPAWADVFSELEKTGRPILWHVTQRTGYSPYHGGGEMSYWNEAPAGSGLANEDLLAMTLEVTEKYPGIPVIGAHQMHLGLERLRELLNRYENLYIDTSCGFFVRWCDVLYEDDREILHDFICEFADKILFGSDCAMKLDSPDQYAIESFLAHARFIHQLRLPAGVLNAVAYENTARVFGMGDLPDARRDNVRP